MSKKILKKDLQVEVLQEEATSNILSKELITHSVVTDYLLASRQSRDRKYADKK